MWISINFLEKKQMEKKLIPIKDVIKAVGFKSSWIYQKIQNDEFPKPVKIGRSSRWIESEVNAWNESQINR
jgi:predicted DNA-binding transcriptional regulator AlpA